MHRIAGVNLPDEKRAEIGLTYVYGIGRSRSLKILENVGINPDRKIKDLSDEEINKIREYIDKTYKVEGDLRREIQDNIKRLKEVGSYRGERHKKGLPVRGQRTRTNARTKRGKKITMGSGRKNPAQKT